MKRQSLLKITFHTFLAGLCSMAALPAQAQQPDIPPKVATTFDFEGLDATDFGTDTIMVNGKRWRLHNARVVNDSIYGIPQGRSAIQIKAGIVDDEYSNLELLDDVYGNTISFSFVHYGMDKVINDNKCWYIEATFDGGNTWAMLQPVFDKRTEAVLQNYLVPAKPDAPYRVRFRFDDKNNNQGRDFSVMVDNIRFMEGNEYSVPWHVVPGNIFNGFETAESFIDFPAILSGATYRFGPAEWGGTTAVELRIDDKEPITYNTMPEGIHLSADNISEGKHHLNIRWINTVENKVWEDAIPTDLDFYVRPIEPIKGIAALKNAEVGKFYELTPADGKDIIVNWTSSARAQKWLFDGEAGILLDDPQYLDPVAGLPLHPVHMKTIRGRLVKMSNNLMFRLDRKAESDTIAEEKFLFKNFMCEDLSLITKNADAYHGYPLSLVNVEFVPKNGLVDCRPNGLIEIVDKQGNKLIMQNIYPGQFSQDRLPSAKKVVVFGTCGYNMNDGTPTFFPLYAIPYETDGVEELGDTSFVTVQHQGETLILSAPSAFEGTIFNLDGSTVWKGNVNGRTAISLPHGLYILKTVDGKNRKEMKFVH